MIKYYYRSLRGSTMQELETFKPGSWVHAVAPNEMELEQLTERFELEPGYLEDALDEDEMSRLETENGQTYIFVRFAHRESDGSFETIPLLIVTTKTAILTISASTLPAFDVLTTGKWSVATTQKTKLVLLMLQAITEQYDTLISRTSRKIKSVRSRLREHTVTNQDFVDFFLIEDELNEFAASLQPNNAILRRLLRGHHLQLFEEDQDLVEDLLLSNEQSLENCNSNIKAIVGVRDAHNSISTNRLNQTMKILTFATLAVAIPNMFFGLYGMNVPLPLQHLAVAFWVIVTTSLLFTLIIFVTGRKRKVF
ncbi:MAG: magnesium transporter CorA family protein [Candidatus Saccharimonadales bacterium]|jgi:magnesium transporter